VCKRLRAAAPGRTHLPKWASRSDTGGLSPRQFHFPRNLDSTRIIPNKLARKFTFNTGGIRPAFHDLCALEAMRPSGEHIVAMGRLQPTNNPWTGEVVDDDGAPAKSELHQPAMPLRPPPDEMLPVIEEASANPASRRTSDPETLKAARAPNKTVAPVAPSERSSFGGEMSLAREVEEENRRVRSQVMDRSASPASPLSPPPAALPTPAIAESQPPTVRASGGSATSEQRPSQDFEMAGPSFRV